MTITVQDREKLRAALQELGFDSVGFASSDAKVGADFDAWLAAGHHADMAWLERGRAKRHDPELVLAGARSLVLLGVNYLPPEGSPSRTQSRWAKYALYSDYHDTLGDGLRAAGAVIERDLGLAREDHRTYVDTGPVLERGWAATAGVGWRGKNGMLISREHGNWLFLAAVLVRAEIPSDEPLRKRAGENPTDGTGLFCGSCTRCIEACPTAAFPKPGWVDARRCISYHTIENRGVIPRELRARFGPRVFGCDVCLDVCPWNRFARAGRSTLLAAREAIADLSLVDLLTMDEAGFREVFRRTPVKRSKLTGLLRNACIAAGNWHDSTDWHFGAGAEPAEVAEAVAQLCRQADEIVRVHAVWALFRLLGPERARDRLRAELDAESSPVVLEEYRAHGEARG